MPTRLTSTSSRSKERISCPEISIRDATTFHSHPHINCAVLRASKPLQLRRRQYRAMRGTVSYGSHAVRSGRRDECPHDGACDRSGNALGAIMAAASQWRPQWRRHRWTRGVGAVLPSRGSDRRTGRPPTLQLQQPQPCRRIMRMPCMQNHARQGGISAAGAGSGTPSPPSIRPLLVYGRAGQNTASTAAAAIAQTVCPVPAHVRQALPLVRVRVVICREVRLR